MSGRRGQASDECPSAQCPVPSALWKEGVLDLQLMVLRVGATIGWTAVGIVVLYVATRVYDMLDPIDYQAEIKAGNVAAAIKLAAVTIGLAAIVVAAIVT